MTSWSTTGTLANMPFIAISDVYGRQKRFQELSKINATSVYNQVYHLQKPDYQKDVTEESNKAYVLVLLTSSQGTNGESRILIEIWRDLAQRFGDIKFCQIRADMCIEGYPEKNTPTVLVYRDGDIKRQLVTLRELRGGHTSVAGTFTLFIVQPLRQRIWPSPTTSVLSRALCCIVRVSLGDYHLVAVLFPLTTISTAVKLYFTLAD